MPYIKQEDRVNIDIDNIKNAGELNYLMSIIFDVYLEKNGLSYNTINTIIGAIECSKLELYRRVAVPYENYKRHKNGEVYDWAFNAMSEYVSKKD